MANKEEVLELRNRQVNRNRRSRRGSKGNKMPPTTDVPPSPPTQPSKPKSKKHKKHKGGTYIKMTSTERDDEDGLMVPSDRELLIDDEEGDVRKEAEESSLTIAMQVFFPYLVAGMGMVGAGLVLDHVQHWDVFVKLSEIFIMVPALLGLKGNLEMTLASRLSTHANLGNMDSKKHMWSMIFGNLALIQCQAIVVGFLASLVAIIMGWIPEGNMKLDHVLLLSASAIVTASLASFILGIIMVLVVILSRKCRINPDNVATPIAASLGDLTTLALLSGISRFLFTLGESGVWLSLGITVTYLLSIPLWVYLAKKNEHTAEVLRTGWTPVIAAMMISSLGGIILDLTVVTYSGIAVFQPVINGVGGNLVAVQASRLSTSLHKLSVPGSLPKAFQSICINPLTMLCRSGESNRCARVLMLLVVPGHLIFAYMISYLKAGHTSLTPIFMSFYLLAALFQVFILLNICQVMVTAMWKVGIDPDNSSIPYLTALGDLLGTALLAVAFHLLYLVGDGDSDVGD